MGKKSEYVSDRSRKKIGKKEKNKINEQKSATKEKDRDDQQLRIECIQRWRECEAFCHQSGAQFEKVLSRIKSGESRALVAGFHQSSLEGLRARGREAYDVVRGSMPVDIRRCIDEQRLYMQDCIELVIEGEGKNDQEFGSMIGRYGRYIQHVATRYRKHARLVSGMKSTAFRKYMSQQRAYDIGFLERINDFYSHRANKITINGNIERQSCFLELGGADIDSDVHEELLTKLVEQEYQEQHVDCVCSITQRILISPVVASDGNTYELEAIIRYMQEHIGFDIEKGKRILPKSPLTREPMDTILTFNSGVFNQLNTLIVDRNHEYLKKESAASRSLVTP